MTSSTEVTTTTTTTMTDDDVDDDDVHDDDVDDDDVHDDDVDDLITGEQAKRNTFNFFSRIFGSKKIFFSIDVGLFFKTLNKVGLNLEQQRENSEIEKNIG